MRSNTGIPHLLNEHVRFLENCSLHEISSSKPIKIWVQWGCGSWFPSFPQIHMHSALFIIMNKWLYILWIHNPLLLLLSTSTFYKYGVQVDNETLTHGNIWTQLALGFGKEGGWGLDQGWAMLINFAKPCVFNSVLYGNFRNNNFYCSFTTNFSSPR